PSFGAFLRALATSSDVEVLSSPQLITMDNETAQIEVGQVLPFPGAVQSTALGAPAGGALFGSAVSVDRKEVALKLRITPQINHGGSVRLVVEQEIADVLDPNYNHLGPATSKRHLQTVVEVEDQQPIVLGGLITERLSQSESKVPLL